MAIWPVDIVGGNPETFVAPYQPKAPVGTVYADPGDVVFWNNTTNENHQISLLLAAPNKGVVTPGHQTDAFVVPGDMGPTIPYKCLMHPQAMGTIVVTGA